MARQKGHCPLRQQQRGQTGGTVEPIPVGLSPKPCSPSPQPLAWLNPASSLSVSGPGRGRGAVRRSHCPGCPHREQLPSAGTELGQRGPCTTFVTAAPEHLPAGQGAQPGTPNPLPAWTPSPLSTLGAAPSTALIPYMALPCPPTPCSLFEIVQLRCTQRSTPSHACFKQEKRASHNPKPPQTHVEGCRMTPGSCVCCWLSWLGFSTAVVPALPTEIAGHGQGKPSQQRCRSSLSKPSGTQGGSPRKGGMWDGGCSCFWHHQVFQYRWFMVYSALIPAGSWDWRAAPSAPASSCALLLEYRKEFPLLNINIPVARCIQM